MAKPRQVSKRELQKRLQKRLARRGQAAPDSRIVQRAEELIERRQWDEARELLEQADRARPGQMLVMLQLLDVYHKQGELGMYCETAERVVEYNPNSPPAYLALASGCMAAMRPARALLAFRTYVERWPDDPLAVGARETITQLERCLDEMLADFPFPADQRVELAAMHERMLSHLTAGNYERVIELGKALLARSPGFTPAMNNLSHAYWQAGQEKEAIRLARNVLAADPENFHALANLARLLLLTGQPEEAQAFCVRLHAAHSDDPDIWCKQVETYSFFGDDAGVLAALAEAERIGTTQGDTPEAALLLHLAGVAAARTGDWRGAQELWRRAIRSNPRLDLAEENLADSKRPLGERQGPWPFGMEYWIRKGTLDRLAAAIEKQAAGGDRDAQDRAVRQFAQAHPELATLVPHLLDRGDEAGREFAWRLAQTLDTPLLREALRNFCLSQRGPDDLRLQVANYLSQHGLLPDGRVRLWLEGEWRDVECMGYEITPEPMGRPHTPQVNEWASAAVDALHRKDAVAAERLLRKCAEAEPDRPELLNNLAQALLLLGRESEAESLIRQVHERWPDYFFGRVSMANLALREGKLDEAEAFIAPLRRQKRLHTTEFDALANVFIELSLARGNRDTARSWLAMWKQVNPDHPAIPEIERRLSGRGLRRLLSNLMGKRR